MIVDFMHRMKSEFTEQLPFLVGIPAIVWQTVFFLIPLCFIVYLSFTSSLAAEVGITLKNYKALFDLTYGAIIIRSFFFLY